MVDRLTHAPASVFLKDYLSPWATWVAARFGRPVYLVGSSLVLPMPRDVDVRCVVSTEEFTARYGDPEAWSKAQWWPNTNDGSLLYAADMWEITREVSLKLQLNLDFQVQPPLEARRYKLPRIRIDKMKDLTEVDL